jgi:hypothetical protein
MCALYAGFDQPINLYWMVPPLCHSAFSLSPTFRSRLSPLASCSQARPMAQSHWDYGASSVLSGGTCLADTGIPKLAATAALQLHKREHRRHAHSILPLVITQTVSASLMRYLAIKRNPCLRLNSCRSDLLGIGHPSYHEDDVRGTQMEFC